MKEKIGRWKWRGSISYFIKIKVRKTLFENQDWYGTMYGDSNSK
jgi:hypothetical protein